MPTLPDRLADLGLELPAAPPPVASYVPARVAGGSVVVSGQLPFVDGGLMATGLVGGEVTLETAARCAERCAVNGLAAAAEAVAQAEAIDRGAALARVTGVIRVGCFVACGPGFTDQAKVANGASEWIGRVFDGVGPERANAAGLGGRHARAAVGCSSLPLGTPVEVEFLFELGG